MFTVPEVVFFLCKISFQRFEGSHDDDHSRGEVKEASYLLRRLSRPKVSWRGPTPAPGHGSEVLGGANGSRKQHCRNRQDVRKEQVFAHLGVVFCEASVAW